MYAPGHPGIAPTWTSSAKDMVGCALGASRLWFTTGYGILNEVYYPRADLPQIRDLGFIVADGKGLWVEVKRLGSYRLMSPQPGIPLVEVVHQHPRFELHLRMAPDPQREALLIEMTLTGDDALRPYALLAPHLGASGKDNWAGVGEHRGRRVLWAEKAPFGLTLAAADDDQGDAWGQASAGYVGFSDGWQDFARNGALTWHYDSAGPGNVALMGELPRRATLALAFAPSKESAATLAFAALFQPFAEVWDQQVGAWHNWQSNCRVSAGLPPALTEQLAISAMVLRVHHDKTYLGAIAASLSIPWGNSRDDTGGYHLVWSRDSAETAGALLALGAEEEARNVLRYLIATQQEDGHWVQNQWFGGEPFWQGVQLDETGFPVLLAAALHQRGALDGIRVEDMVCRALAFIAREGPVTGQDRWEEDPGINTFTLAVIIAALVEGAAFLDDTAKNFALELADDWNAAIEDWTYVTDTGLARQAGVPGYYARTAPADVLTLHNVLDEWLPIKNRDSDPNLPAKEQIATEFLQLVRFGLRLPSDRHIVSSVRAIDALLQTETPNGPVWHRYNGDGYGEHDDGTPFDGSGRGRGWPLLTGERGHYALACGEDPLPYLRAMAAMTGPGGLIPEQVWDAEAIQERGLYPGKPSGSAMPLVWAHAEFIKLAYSAVHGTPVDRPAAVWERYQGRPLAATRAIWSFRCPIAEMPTGRALRLLLTASAVIHWGSNGWAHVSDITTRDTKLGLHIADLPAQQLRAGERVNFTFYWPRAGRWEGRDFEVKVIGN